MSRSKLTVPITLSVVAISLGAMNLRPGATSIGPVLEEIRHGLPMNTAQAAILTALPGLVFAAAGAVSGIMRNKFGTTWAFTLGLYLSVVGLLARTFMPSPWPFLLLSIVALAGVGAGNVMLPVYIKTQHPVRAPTMMSIYAASLSFGAAVPGMVAAPITDHATGGWRASLGLWGLTTALAAAVWTLIGFRIAGRDRPVHHEHTARMSIRSVARNRKAIALAVFFGVQSMQAYVTFGWLAQIFRDDGLSQAEAGWMIALFNGCGIFGGLLMPAVVARVRTMAPIMIGFGVLLVAGYVGLMTAAASAPILWTLLLGLSGLAFPTSLALITARSRDPHVTAALSGFSQSVGYAFAAGGPFVIGMLHSATGGWTIPLIVMAASAIVLTISGIGASRPGDIDDEIAL